MDLNTENLPKIKVGVKNWVLNYEAAFGKVLVSHNSSPGIRKDILNSENLLILKGKLSQLSPQLVIYSNKEIDWHETDKLYIPTFAVVPRN